VLAVCTATGLPNGPDEVLAARKELGSPAEVVVNLTHEESAELVRSAGIYLHTFSFDEPFGMPISIAEAMATGAHVLARGGPGVAEYLGPCGASYGSPDEAARLIQETAAWTEEKWQATSLAAINQAYRRHADSVVLASMLKDWCSLAAERSAVRRAA
jgi:glycosyltransferase involved in cell wall biosynthesis